MPTDSQNSSTIAIFVVLNFALAGLCLLWTVLLAIVLVYGIFFSGDQGGELAAGIAGSVLLALPGVMGSFVYLLAGIGLTRRRSWGYYFHCGGAVLAAFSCVGILYTVLALVFATRPEFSGGFLGSARGGRP